MADFITSVRSLQNPSGLFPVAIPPVAVALVDIDKLTHAVPEGEGAPVPGGTHIDVPHSLSELENVLAGRERTDDGESSRAGFGVRDGWRMLLALSALLARRLSADPRAIGTNDEPSLRNQK